MLYVFLHPRNHISNPKWIELVKALLVPGLTWHSVSGCLGPHSFRWARSPCLLSRAGHSSDHLHWPRTRVLRSHLTKSTLIVNAQYLDIHMIFTKLRFMGSIFQILKFVSDLHLPLHVLGQRRQEVVKSANKTVRWSLISYTSLQVKFVSWIIYFALIFEQFTWPFIKSTTF